MLSRKRVLENLIKVDKIARKEKKKRMVSSFEKVARSARQPRHLQ